ncbi:MAG: DEAD/DEAH box helicase [Planctomycetaceae bacterium]|nr:MAG: DEAD/DEAH box helicase [Planctomycetaceae bacterium]
MSMKHQVLLIVSCCPRILKSIEILVEGDALRVMDTTAVQAAPAEAEFRGLGLSERAVQGAIRAGFTQPSPIQKALIPAAISGRDCIGLAQTGTGKTAAYTLPLLGQLDFKKKQPQALVLTPTRELSQQVIEEAARLAGTELKTACLVGGRPLGPQREQLQRGAQLVVGTPGRVVDLLQRKILRLASIRVLVLDEADRMLDIGFRPEIERILQQAPVERLTLMLSATLPPPLERLAQRYLRDPVRIDLTPKNVAAETIDQYYITVPEPRKLETLVRLLKTERPRQAIVFHRTKRGCEQVYQHFAGRLPGVAFIHGDLPQKQRDRVMRHFREGKIRLLFATDVMGRGIDVSGVSHIINYDIPEDSDDYVHRVGRTGRLSSQEERGAAMTFVCPDQGELLTAIEKRINRLLEPYRWPTAPAPPSNSLSAGG